MHEDPTRMMRTERHDPQHPRPRGNIRLVVACLIAVIVGLLIAIFAIAGSGGGTTTVTISETVETLPETTNGRSTTSGEIEEAEEGEGAGGLEAEEGGEAGEIEGLEGEEEAPLEKEGGGVEAE